MKDELPPEDVPLLCMRGGNVYVAWFILGKWKGDKYNDVKNLTLGKKLYFHNFQRRVNRNMIKTMTKEEYASYRHAVYLKYADSRRAKQKEYYQKHKEEIKAKARLRYRKRCGL